MLSDFFVLHTSPVHRVPWDAYAMQFYWRFSVSDHMGVAQLLVTLAKWDLSNLSWLFAYLFLMFVLAKTDNCRERGLMK